MIVEKLYEAGSRQSCIRQLFEYGLQQSAIVGKENVFDFSIGNPTVPAPKKVTDAFRALAASGATRSLHGYTVSAGNMDARSAVAADLTRRSGMLIRPQNLFLTCGAAPALVSVIRALAVEHAEIAVIAPYFPEYRPFIEGSGAKFVAAAPDYVNFQINLRSLEEVLTPNTQAVIVNSPNNPSGVVYTRETLRALAALLTEKEKEFGHPIYIIADEPYRELVYDGAEVPYIPAIYPDTVLCYSYSKSFSLPGERIGYFCIPDCAADSGRLYAAAAGAARLMGHVCAPSLQQRVIEFCSGGDVKPDLEPYDRNRRLLYKALTSYGYECVKPSGAFYLFVKSPAGSAAEFSERAKAENLLVVPGDDFGCPAYFRLSTCVEHDMILRSLPVFQKLIQARRPGH